MTDPISTATSTVLGPDPDRAATSTTTADLPQDTSPVAAPPDPEVPSVGVFTDRDGRVHYASPSSKMTLANLESEEWVLGQVEREPRFDPTTSLVRDVIAYLVEHASDYDEIQRVKAAEAAGEDRPTIREWDPNAE